MDLPFAVDPPDRGTSSSLHHSNSSSLISASSQGSPLPIDSAEHSTSGVSSAPRHGTPQGQATLHPQHIPSSVTTFPEVSTTLSSDTEMVDFTYVTAADADEVDIVVDGRDPTPDQDWPRGDVLAILLSGDTQSENNTAVVQLCEEANDAAQHACEAKQKGDFPAALNAHAEAAKTFREAAVTVREKDASLFESLLLLSQTQAKSALALKRFLKQHPDGILHKDKSATGTGPTSSLSHKERLRATLRGALSSQKEADISDSMFLGRSSSSNAPAKASSDEAATTPAKHNGGDEASQNPVDEMMALERELRDMDMALEMGNSIMSLGARTQSRLKQSTLEDGSFYVVPPGQSSYTSSSLWASGINPTSRPASGSGSGSGPPGPRARVNRGQNMLDPSAATPAARANVSPPTSHVSATSQQRNAAPSGLESSWWGNQSTASQMLASSFVNMGSSRIALPESDGQPANTKQLMRMLDSIKTLGEENAALLREVESAEAARNEAKASREEMRRFQKEYGKRFEFLKSALEQFRKDYPQHEGGQRNPVTTSNFVQTASAADQIQRQEQLIRKLTADLKREKEESKKKDGALRKYESFYREVKARSAQKAAQREKEAQRRQRSKILTTRAPR